MNIHAQIFFEAKISDSLYFCNLMHLLRCIICTLTINGFVLLPLSAQQDTLPGNAALPADTTLKAGRTFMHRLFFKVDTSKAKGYAFRPSKAVRTFFTKNYPQPRKAAFLSLILPGAGQIYNRSWWKLPLVYGTLGTVTYFELRNIRQYRTLRDNYRLVVDGDPLTNPTEAPYNQMDRDRLRYFRDLYRQYVEQTSLVLGLAYVLQAADAFVDAHLSSFDVRDDLSLQLRPRLINGPFGGTVVGIGISIPIGASENKQMYTRP
jgi:Family of unknown function (DUF5683)